MSKNHAAKQVSQTEVAVQEAPKLPVVQDIGQTMQDTGITASDLVIPKLLLMQNTSDAVGENKAKLGDILNSQTNEVLGGLEKPVPFIPLKLFKTWQVMDLVQEKSGIKAVFKRSEPVTAKNEKLPWEDVEDGKPIRRDFCMNFFGLLVEDVEKDEAFPVVVRFKRTSTGAGKQLATTMFKMGALGRAPYSQVVQLSVKKDKHETNTYALFEITKGRQATDKELAAAKEWLGNLSRISYTIDESRDDSAPSQGAAPAPTVVAAASSPSDVF